MPEGLIPVIGSRGSYKFAAPFNTENSENGVTYVCQGVRTFSDYLAANEDLKALIYTKYSLSDAEYSKDQEANAYIVSLQADDGHWVHVPSRFITTLPAVNGIIYRAMMMVTAFPSLPADTNFDGLKADIADLCKGRFGVTVQTKMVESSLPVLISKTDHEQAQTDRNLAKMSKSTLYAQVESLKATLEAVKQKLEIAEQYIIDHHQP